MILQCLDMGLIKINKTCNYSNLKFISSRVPSPAENPAERVKPVKFQGNWWQNAPPRTKKSRLFSGREKLRKLNVGENIK